MAALTPNQHAVGTALDQASPARRGDFATVLSVLAGLDTVQGPAALDAISGQPYADFGTVNTTSSYAFMNALGQQMAARDAGGAGRAWRWRRPATSPAMRRRRRAGARG